MARWTATLCIAALLAVFAPIACAHAHLDRALPATGSAVRESPRQVKLWFTQRLEAAFSEVRVIDAAGRRVDNDDAKVDADDAKLLRVSVPPLSPGIYRVRWRVLSIDTHVDEGEFTFDVEP
jgi:methionine-rich copper-binding protein CopC